MSTFAEALNSVKASVGLEDGSVYIVNGLTGDEIDVVGEYQVLQTNSGPDVRHDNGKFGVFASRADTDETFTAEYDPAAQQWS